MSLTRLVGAGVLLLHLAVVLLDELDVLLDVLLDELDVLKHFLLLLCFLLFDQLTPGLPDGLGKLAPRPWSAGQLVSWSA
jgi:hypothetical protein